ncbi:PAS domain S-box protein [Flavobacterium sp. Arc3]|jgi:PAS domain S-box-containing protein|uniref:PAS domain S-box protein n=1 Tax=Flavobacterium sp. Arc3 TaxID=3046686 RepID=UPI00352C295B
MKTKILILEHDDTDIELIQHELKKGGVNYTPKIVRTGNEYEKALHDFKPDIILSNYILPSFGGIIAFELKEKLAPQTPFIFVTESIGEEKAIELIKNGVTDLVLKENLSTLIDKVNCALTAAKQTLLNQSKKKRTEELCKDEAKFKALFENSIDGILLTVTDGQILAANPAACEIFQKTEQEIIDAGRYGIADNSDPRLEPMIKELQRTGRVTGELTLIHKDGTKFPAELTSAVYKDSNGEERTSMIIRDITKHKQAAEKISNTTNFLQQALNDLNKTLDFSLDLILSYNEDGKIVRINKASELILGYQAEELIGQKYLNYIFHDDVKDAINADIDIRSGMQLTMFENRFIQKNGSVVSLLWSAVWDDESKLSYYIGKDTTEKKNLEKAFEIERQRCYDLYSQAPSCIGVLKGANHVYELANELYLQLINKKNIIGKTIKEVLPELESQGIFKFLDIVYQTGETFSANEMLVKFDPHGNGKLVDTYLNFIYQAHRDTDNNIDGILFFVNDVTEQVLSRKKIEESLMRYTSLIEQASDAISIIDPFSKIIEVNQYACDKLGYSKEEFIALSIDDLFLKEDLMANPLKKDELKKEKIIRSERRFKRKDNTLIEVELSAKIMEDGNTILIARDITEQNQAQHALKESEKKYRLLFENNPMPMWVIDSNTFRFLDVNEMAILQYGYSREEFLSMTALDIRPEEDKERFRRQANKSFESNGAINSEQIWNHRKKDGTIIVVEIVGQEIIFEGSSARLILSSNISERKIAEDSLLQSESRLKEAQTIAHFGSWELNLKTGIFLWSDEKCYIYGLSPEDNKHSYSSMLSFIHPDDINQVMTTILNESQGTLCNIVLNYRIVLKDGTIKHIASESKFEFDQNGKPIKLFGISNDVTEIKLAKLQLEQQNKELAYQNFEKESRANELLIANRELAFQNSEKEDRANELIITNRDLIKTNIELDRFVYSVSHDLRSPLTSILGLISFIEEESEEADTLEHANMIRNSINRLDEFIKKILSYSRNNRTGLEIEQIPLQKTVIDIAHSLQSMKEGKGINFIIDIEEQQPFHSDKLRFNTILVNLISNAIKYHKDEKSNRYIKIVGQSDHEILQITIEDNGIGIAPAYHSKIFEMFFRLSGTKDGSGIGLYIVKDTLGVLQGTIKIHSEEGVGTAFTITLKNLKK